MKKKYFTLALLFAFANLEASEDLVRKAVFLSKTEQFSDYSPLREWYSNGDLKDLKEVLKNTEISGLEYNEKALDKFLTFRSTITLPENISEKDLALLLAFHGSAHSIASQKLEKENRATAYNRQAWTYHLSQQAFEQAADSVAMPPKTKQALSAVLEYNTTGEYLAGNIPSKTTFNFYIRDSARSGINLTDFYGLHVLIHQIITDAPLTSMAPVLNLIDSYEEFKKYIMTSGAENDLQQWTDTLKEKSFQEKCKINKAKEEEIIEKRSFYQNLEALRLQKFYREKQEHFLESLKNIRQHLKHFEIPGIVSLILEILDDYLQESDGKSYGVYHGANSHILIGLRNTAATLIPSGILSNFGIIPLSGELREGSTGINRQGISVSYPKGYNTSLNVYANGFHFNPGSVMSSVQTAIDSLKAEQEKKHPPIQNETPKEFQELPYPKISYEVALDRRFFKRNLQSDRETAGLPNSLNRLRWLDPAEFNKSKEILLPLLEAEMSALTVLKNTQFYIDHVPKEYGGRYHDYTYINLISGRERWLTSCFSALNTKTQLEKQTSIDLLSEEPFPIIFESVAPCVSAGRYKRSEAVFTGFLRLNREIKRILVPQDKIEFIKQWIKENGMPNTEINVSAIEGFTPEMPTHF